MQFVIQARVSSLVRPDTAEVASGDALPCLQGGWPLVPKPLNRPWAKHCWN